MKIDPLDKAGYRQFGLIMSAFILLVFGIFFPWVFGKNIAYWPWMVSAVFLILSLFVPMKLAVIYKPWMITGHIIGTINTKLILGIIFFLVFTPMALLFRVLGKDPMNRQISDTSRTSYWEESKKQSKDHVERVF